MTKKWTFILLLCCIVIATLAACSSTTGGVSVSSGSTGAKGNEVHMSDTDFVQKTVTIKKGESITLISDTFTPHIIANGTWKNNTAQAASEPHAPAVKNLQINGNASDTIGPFNTTGTFNLYCTIHASMNLTVIVA